MDVQNESNSNEDLKSLSKKYASDDTELIRPFTDNADVKRTTKRASSMMIYPSNSFVASNGEVYSVEPFMMPPPSEIAQLMSQVGHRRERGDSNLGMNESKSHHVSSSLDQALQDASNGSPFVNRKLTSMTPFSPGTLNASVEWLVPGKPKSILTSTPAGKGRDSGGDGDHGAKREDHLQTEISADYRSRTASAPSFLNRGENSSESGSSSPQSPSTPSSARPTWSGNSLTGHLGVSTDSNDNPYAPGLHRRNLQHQHQHQQHQQNQQQTNNQQSISDARERFADQYAKHTQQPPSEAEYFHLRKFSVLNYLKVEMFGIGESEKGERRGDDNITNFLTVPFKIERMVWFGFFVCLDAFWYTLTYLPLRCLYSIYVLAKELRHSLVSLLLGMRVNNEESKLRGRYFHRTHAYDIMVGALMIFGAYGLSLLNMGRVYHYIRGQNMIKLYVLTAMLEIFDKLLSSFGQDAFDSLYWQTRRYDGAETGKIAFSFIVVAFYVVLHSGIYFIHIATLTVAINSAEQALITVLILNNFAEIKSFVFKKFDKQNLFQLACSDITERFQLCLFLTIITFVAFAQSGSVEDGWRDVLPSHCFVILVMVAGESVADWIKHAFISKFNFIDASVYDDFMRVLRKDILNSQKEKVILNHTYAITRRVGLSQIPLGCVAVRYMNLAFSSIRVKMAYSALTFPRRLYLCVITFAVMVLFKVFIGIALIVVSGFEHNKELAAKAAKLQQLADGGKVPLIKRESLAQLSNIERYTVYRGKVLG
jgi:Eukaryotic membrane protein family